jgi:hypothetical protein
MTTLLDGTSIKPRPLIAGIVALDGFCGATAPLNNRPNFVQMRSKYA